MSSTHVSMDLRSSTLTQVPHNFKDDPAFLESYHQFVLQEGKTEVESPPRSHSTNEEAGGGYHHGEDGTEATNEDAEGKSGRSMHCIYCDYKGTTKRNLDKHYKAHATSYKVGTSNIANQYQY